MATLEDRLRLLTGRIGVDTKDIRTRVFAFKRNTVIATGLDQAAEVQSKLDALADGGTLQLIGQVRTLVPIVARRNKRIRGEVAPRWSYQTTPATSLRPMAGFVGVAALLIPQHTITDATLPAIATARAEANDNGRIENLIVDCSAISPGGDRGIYGIFFEGLVRNWEIRNSATLSARGIGVGFQQGRGSAVPRGITAEHVQAVYSKGVGFYLAYTTDSNMTDLLAVGGETDGHYHLACAETHFEDIRAVFNKGRGIVLGGTRSIANAVAYGSVSTDRNALDGLSIQQAGTFPIRIGSATLNRDGSASATADYAALVLGADAVRIAPVSIGYLSVTPGVDDPAAAGETGGGIFSPQHVVRQGNTTRVEIGTRMGWSANVPIFESGGSHSNPPFTSYEYLRQGTDGTVTASRNWVTELAAAPVSGGGSTATATPATTTTALARLYAAIARRDTAPVPIFTGGSSTSTGQGATNDNRAEFNRWVNTLQADFPLSSGAAQPTQRDYSAGMTLAVGIGHVRTGTGGTNSGNYLDATKCAGIGALSPATFAHQIGSNDMSINRPPATVKSDVLSWAQQIDAAVPSGAAKPVHILVHGHRRTNVSNPTYSWNAYGAVFAQLATEYPEMFVFVNLYDAFRKVGQDSVYQHYMMYATGGPNDGIHLTDAGHAFGADQLRAATRETLIINTPAPTAADPANPTAPADTSAPTISSFSASNGNAQSVITWAGTDNVGITRWVLKRAGTTIYDGTATTFTDTGLTNGTTYSYGLTAYDAAGNTATASASATPVAATSALSNTTAPAVTPTTATTGQTLTTTNGAWNVTPDSYTYQWKRAGVDILGATSQSYVTVAADQGVAVTVDVTAIKSGYTSTSTSNSVTPSAPVQGGADYTTNMMAQYKSTSITEAAGAALNAWSSSAGSAGAATMNQVVAAPVVVADGPNSRKAVRFAGGSNSTAPSLSVVGTALEVPRLCSYFYVIRRIGPMQRAIGSGQNESSRYHALYDTLAANGITFNVGSLSNTNNEALTYTASILNRWIIVGVVARANGDTSRMRIGLSEANLTVTALGAGSTTTNYGITLGTSGARTGAGQFDIAELRVYSEAMTDANMQTVMQALATEYALA